MDRLDRPEHHPESRHAARRLGEAGVDVALQLTHYERDQFQIINYGLDELFTVVTFTDDVRYALRAHFLPGVAPVEGSVLAQGLAQMHEVVDEWRKSPDHQFNINIDPEVARWHQEVMRYQRSIMVRLVGHRPSSVAPTPFRRLTYKIHPTEAKRMAEAVGNALEGIARFKRAEYAANPQLLVYVEDPLDSEPADKIYRRREAEHLTDYGALVEYLSRQEVPHAPMQSALLGISRDVSFMAYVKSAEHTRLPKERIVELGRLVQTGKRALQTDKDSPKRTQDIERAVPAGREIALHHRKLVIKIALQYYWLDLDEAIQMGNVGLMRAVAKYDPDKTANPGGAFSTVAVPWIRAEIMLLVKQEQRRKNVLGKFDNFDRQLLARVYAESHALDERITWEDAGKWLGFNASKVNHLRNGQTAAKLLSLQRPRYKDIDSGELIEMLQEPWTEGDFARIENSVDAHRLWHAVKVIATPVQYRSLIMRFVYGMTNAQIAVATGMSESAASQSVRQGIQRLKNLRACLGA